MASILHDSTSFPPYGEHITGAKAVRASTNVLSSYYGAVDTFKRTALKDDGNFGEGLLWTTQLNVELPVRLKQGDIGSTAACTLIELFSTCVAEHGELQALSYKPYSNRNGPWISYTWKQYWNECCRYGKAIMKLGLRAQDTCAIMGCNSPFWNIAHMGTIMAGGVSTAVYPSSTESAAEFILNQTEALVIMVDTRENAEKILNIKPKLSSLKKIVMYYDEMTEELERRGVVSIHNFLEYGNSVHDIALAERMKNQTPGKCCSIIYTSGTTGVPKGAMLSHDCCTWTAFVASKYISNNIVGPLVSYLPLSHIAAQVVDIYLPLCLGHQVYFSDIDALKGSLLKTLKDVRPIWLIGVPRVFEKFEAALKAILNNVNPAKRKLLEWAMNVEYEGTMAMLKNKPPPYSYNVAHWVTGKIRRELGLDRCRGFGTCAAPISESTVLFFLRLGMPICNIYGLSETTGPQTVSACCPDWFKIGTIGRTMGGTEIMVHAPDAEGKGELCYRGRNVFMGYYKNKVETTKVIDADGFFHSGDTGYLDEDKYVVICGRLKELLITAGGENIAPVYIEDLVKKYMPFVNNCQVIGDKRRHLALLICLKSVMDADGQPTTILSPDVVALLENHGSSSKTMFEAQDDFVLTKLVNEALKSVNEEVASAAQCIRKWRILPNDFSESGGELTPTLKLKRSSVTAKYAKLIDEMYEEGKQTQSKL